MYNNTMFQMDNQFETYPVRDVSEVRAPDGEHPYPSCCVTTEAGSLFVEDQEGVGHFPKVNDIVRFYGKGFGYTVRGIALVDGFNVLVYRYQTAAEEEAAFKAYQEKERANRESKFQEGFTEFRAKVDALPEPFKARIDRFLLKPGWGPEFGGYELFSCLEALKIVARVKNPADLKRFYDMKYEDQRLMVPDLDEGHSGNTFGMACLLARIYMEKPKMLPNAHGALCALVGCSHYGCYAASLKKNQDPDQN